MTSKPLFASARPYIALQRVRTLLGTSGLARVTSGGVDWTRAYAAVGGVLALIFVVNVSSRWHDARAGVPLWRPVLNEGSSIACLVALSWLVFAACDRVATRRLGMAQAMAVHAAAACSFSALHCLGMWTVRRLVLTAAGLPYGWGISAGQVFYEFRKDLVAYTVISLIYQGLRTAPAAASESETVIRTAVADTYTIRDGARLWRVHTRDILAVLSAGNYVEFLMEDGRRIMMRATLSGVLAELEGAGFLRVHRSWIVNAARVGGVSPEKSGDYTLCMDGGACVPMSRRFPRALASLRDCKNRRGVWGAPYTSATSPPT